MLTNEVEKGMTVKLRNGMRAVVMDNQKRQATRLCEVAGSEIGLFDELGSVYSTDIVMANVDGVWTQVTLTPKQAKLVLARAGWGV